jgi:hypothetical protein
VTNTYKRTFRLKRPLLYQLSYTPRKLEVAVISQFSSHIANHFKIFDFRFAIFDFKSAFSNQSGVFQNFRCVDGASALESRARCPRHRDAFRPRTGSPRHDRQSALLIPFANQLSAEQDFSRNRERRIANILISAKGSSGHKFSCTFYGT